MTKCRKQVLMVLEGQAHAYVFASPGCKKWDICAPEAILTASGGKLTDLHGVHYSYKSCVSSMRKLYFSTTKPYFFTHKLRLAYKTIILSLSPTLLFTIYLGGLFEQRRCNSNIRFAETQRLHR